MLLILFSISTHARVFSVTESNFATYFKGTFGTSYIKKDAYDKSSGAQTTFSDQVDFNYGGEIGFAFPSKNYSFRIGLEAIAPSSPSGIKGNRISDQTELMSLDSKVLGFFPVAHFEYYVAMNALGRVYLSLGGGYGKVSLTNNYTMTAAGTSDYGLSSFSEKMSQNTYLIETSIGYEMAFIQAVTFCFDFGYRYAIARELKYEDSGTNFLGPHTSGASVVDSDGKHKSLDLGGVFTGLSFRFYFN